MSIRASLLEEIARVAAAFGDDRSKVVFVGGASAALYALRDEPRATEDVDLDVDVTRLEYHRLCERLRRRGFRHSMETGAPSCRFLLDERVVVDVMPTDEGLLGFSNRWYREGVRRSRTFGLPDGSSVRALSPLFFVATKLEAFDARGARDPGMSHDMEDIFRVLEGAQEVWSELATSRDEPALSVTRRMQALMADERFIEAFEWFFPGTVEGGERSAAMKARLLALPAP